MINPLLTFSDALVSRVTGAGPGLVSVHPGGRAQRTAMLLGLRRGLILL